MNAVGYLTLPYLNFPFPLALMRDDHKGSSTPAECNRCNIVESGIATQTGEDH